MKMILFLFLGFIITCQPRQNIANTGKSSSEKFDTIFRRIEMDTLLKINTEFDNSIVQDLNAENEQNMVKFMYFSNNFDENFDVFIQKSFSACNFLDSIGVKNDKITLFLNQKKFYAQKYVGDSVAWAYNYYFYHDVYHAFFRFNKINAIQVFSVDENQNIENETFLPKTGDDEFLIEKAIMCRKWYKKTPKEWHYFFEKKREFLEEWQYENNYSPIKHSLLDSLFLE